MKATVTQSCPECDSYEDDQQSSILVKVDFEHYLIEVDPCSRHRHKFVGNIELLIDNILEDISDELCKQLNIYPRPKYDEEVVHNRKVMAEITKKFTEPKLKLEK